MCRLARALQAAGDQVCFVHTRQMKAEQEVPGRGRSCRTRWPPVLALPGESGVGPARGRCARQESPSSRSRAHTTPRARARPREAPQEPRLRRKALGSLKTLTLSLNAPRAGVPQICQQRRGAQTCGRWVLYPHSGRLRDASTPWAERSGLRAPIREHCDDRLPSGEHHLQASQV